jgi:uncharacterized protein (DUF1501 family)
MQCCESRISTTRRSLLLGGASFAAWAYLPKFARGADGRDPRLIVIILRGALDGLATVAPVGDPDYAGLHGPIALSSDGPHAAVMLDSFFVLHPSMPEFARMYREKHAASRSARLRRCCCAAPRPRWHGRRRRCRRPPTIPQQG